MIIDICYFIRNFFFKQIDCYLDVRPTAYNVRIIGIIIIIIYGKMISTRMPIKTKS